MSDSERDKLIESICRLKAERDQLRRKEEKWAQERERVKKVKNGFFKRLLLLRKGNERNGRQRNCEEGRCKAKI